MLAYLLFSLVLYFVVGIGLCNVLVCLLCLDCFVLFDCLLLFDLVV